MTNQCTKKQQEKERAKAQAEVNKDKSDNADRPRQNNPPIPP